jgi:3-hydroxymyristoyl/3-hydroxydecanoyl-(acyl carrier protein) dehydratase
LSNPNHIAAPPGGVPLPSLPALPHVPPFRLVDRILEADPARGSLLAERLLTVDDALWPAESHVAPHFFSPSRPSPSPSKPARGDAPPPAPVFPPTLILEALCQAAACLNALAPPAVAGPSSPPLQHHGYLVAVSDVKFPTFAYVGETLALSVQQQEKLGSVIAFSARATACPSRQMPGNGNGGPDDDDDGNNMAQPREVASGRLLFAVRWA